MLSRIARVEAWLHGCPRDVPGRPSPWRHSWTAMIRSAKRTIAARLASTMAATVASASATNARAVRSGDRGYDEITWEEEAAIIGAP